MSLMNLRTGALLTLLLAGCAGQRASEPEYPTAHAAQHHYRAHDVTGPTPGTPPGTGTAPGTTRALSPAQGTRTEELARAGRGDVWVEQTTSWREQERGKHHEALGAKEGAKEYEACPEQLEPGMAGEHMCDCPME